MIKSKTHITVCKMVCAGLLTFLILQNIVQKSLFVPVSAEDLEESQLETWGNDINSTADKLLQDYVNASGNPELQATYYSSLIAVNAWYSYYQLTANMRDMMILVGDTTIPASRFYFGWYYNGGSPHSGTLFGYGVNGDRIKIPANYGGIVLFSSDEFTVKGFFHEIDNTSISYIFNTYNSNDFTYNVRSLNDYSQYWHELQASAIFSNLIVDTNGQYNTLYAKYPRKYNVTLDTTTFLDRYFYFSSSNRDLLGTLDGISSSSGEMITAQTTTSLPDIENTMYTDLVTAYPEIEELWIPIPDNIPDMSGLTFPPDLPSVSFNAPELPTESLPESMLSGAGFWFTQFNNLLDGLGVKYIVIIIMIAVLLLSILRF